MRIINFKQFSPDTSLISVEMLVSCSGIAMMLHTAHLLFISKPVTSLFRLYYCVLTIFVF
jgi:hypothetical protein